MVLVIGKKRQPCQNVLCLKFEVPYLTVTQATHFGSQVGICKHVLTRMRTVINDCNFICKKAAWSHLYK